MRTDNHAYDRRSGQIPGIRLHVISQKTSYMFGLVGIFKPQRPFRLQSGINNEEQMTAWTPLIDPDGLQDRTDRIQMSTRWCARPPMHIPEGPCS
jgi:hypothetical protein